MQAMPEGTDAETLAKCTEIVHVVEDFLRAATFNAQALVDQLGESRRPLRASCTIHVSPRDAGITAVLRACRYEAE